MYRIEINPKVRIKHLDSRKICVDNGAKRITITGELSNRYFIKNIKYYTSPIEINALYKKLYSLEKDINYNYNDYISVVNMLIEKEILLIRHYNSGLNSDNKKINIVFLDYTNQDVLPVVKTLMDKYISLKCLKDCVFCDYIDVINAEKEIEGKSGRENLLVPILWNYCSDNIDSFKYIEKSDYTVLPVICNYNYFSIGPKIYDDKSRCRAEKILLKEKNRYSYVNPEPSEGYTSIMVSFLIQQIQYIVEELNNWDHRVRVNDELVTYNFNAYSIEVKNYVFAEIKVRGNSLD